VTTNAGALPTKSHACELSSATTKRFRSYAIGLMQPYRNPADVGYAHTNQCPLVMLNVSHEEGFCSRPPLLI
jgi:hypothetical protein